MATSSSTRHLNGLNLHVEEAGPPDGPLVILLHGFPGFWWDWRHQIDALAAVGYRVLAPDMRGYNLSDKPQGLDAYCLDPLAADIKMLADSYGYSTFGLVGHDWGGIVAWWAAARYPQHVERLAILNAPHPDIWRRLVRRRPRQALRSLYIAFFQLPLLPELLLRANRFALLRGVLTHSARSDIFNPEDMELYIETWTQFGALTAMLNYYRALRRRPWSRPERIKSATLIIWGERDIFLELQAAHSSLKLCDRGRAIFLEKATHWAQLEEVEIVNVALIQFFGESNVQTSKRKNRTLQDKPSYVAREKRQPEFVEGKPEDRAVSENETEQHARPTVNKTTGGGKRSGSDRSKGENKTPLHNNGQKSNVTSPLRTAEQRSISAKKAAATRKRNAENRK